MTQQAKTRVGYLNPGDRFRVREDSGVFEVLGPGNYGTVRILCSPGEEASLPNFVAVYPTDDPVRGLSELERLRAKVAAVEDLIEHLDEVAYMQISMEHALTIQPLDFERARVPGHWQERADERARIYRDALRTALDRV